MTSPPTLRHLPTQEAIEIAAQCWCDDETSMIEMDSRLAFAFAQRVQALLDERDAHAQQIATLRAQVEQLNLDLVWHRDCRPNRTESVRRIAEVQATVNQMADAVSAAHQRAEAAEARATTAERDLASERQNHGDCIECHLPVIGQSRVELNIGSPKRELWHYNCYGRHLRKQIEADNVRLWAETTRLQGALDAANAAKAVVETRVDNLKWDMDNIAAQLGLTSREDVPTQVMNTLEAVKRVAVSDTLDRVLVVFDEWWKNDGPSAYTEELRRRLVALRPEPPRP